MIVSKLLLYVYHQMYQEITSYETYGQHNEQKGNYVGMSDTGREIYDTLADTDKILLKKGLNMLMEQVFKDKKINLKSINIIWSKMQKNMRIQNTKEESGCSHTFIGKLTIGTHTYFIKETRKN